MVPTGVHLTHEMLQKFHQGKTKCFNSSTKARKITRNITRNSRHLPLLLAELVYTVVQLGVAHRWVPLVLAIQGGPIRVDQPYSARTHIKVECLKVRGNVVEVTAHCVLWYLVKICEETKPKHGSQLKN